MPTCESMPTQQAALPINYVAIALSCIPVDSVQHHLHCNSNHIYLITIFDLTTAESSRLEAEPTQCKDVEQSFKNSRCMFICVVFQRDSQHYYALEDLQKRSKGLVRVKADVWQGGEPHAKARAQLGGRVLVEQASGGGRRRPLDLCITPQTSDERLNDSRTPRFVKLTGAMPGTSAIWPYNPIPPLLPRT
jgi:hypothetical protein